MSPSKFPSPRGGRWPEGPDEGMGSIASSYQAPGWTKDQGPAAGRQLRRPAVATVTFAARPWQPALRQQRALPVHGSGRAPTRP
jgi:hypothetical protein